MRLNKFEEYLEEGFRKPRRFNCKCEKCGGKIKGNYCTDCAEEYVAEQSSTNGNGDGMGGVKSPKSKLKRFEDFILNEQDASATMGNTGGMGAVTSPTVGSVPGQTWGPGSGQSGSGDSVAHAVKKKVQSEEKKNKKRTRRRLKG
jgi:hypothetical protein